MESSPDSRGQARRRAWSWIVLAAAAALAWWIWPKALHTAATAILESKEIKAGNGAPDFTLKNARGEAVSLESYRGKVVLLNFWATWCGPCKTEIPWFIDLQNRYGAREFTVLGVSMDEDGWKAVTPYVAAHGMNYPVLLGDEKVNQLFGGIEALPTTMIVDKDGKFAYIHYGLVSEAQYEREIQDAMCGGCNKVTEPEAETKQYELHGVVRKVDAKEATATIDGEAVKGWMAAMTMEYPVRDKAELGRLREGEKVAAKVYVAGDRYWVAEIREEK